jgi:hypothetical protein
MNFEFNKISWTVIFSDDKFLSNFLLDLGSERYYYSIAVNQNKTQNLYENKPENVVGGCSFFFAGGLKH